MTINIYIVKTIDTTDGETIIAPYVDILDIKWYPNHTYYLLSVDFCDDVIDLEDTICDTQHDIDTGMYDDITGVMLDSTKLIG